MIEKIILKKSAVEDKMPSPEQLDYGEIALNFNTMNPFISFKDTADGIRQIKDYSNEIQNINGSLTDAKNEIDYLRPLVTETNTNLMFLRSDFEDFKTDNTNEINALRTDIDKNTDAIATKADKTELEIKVNKTDIVQSTGTSTTSVMSQNAVSDALSTKVDKTDITQSTGTSTTSVMSQKAVSDALSNKVDKTDIVQSTGTSETAVMSQKASTDSFIANTPSGDPMHNVYVAVGAKWNAKTGFWELNGLTDITKEQMLTIYLETNNFLMYQSNLESAYCFSKCRTNIPNVPYLSNVVRLQENWYSFFRVSENIEVLVLKHIYSIYFKPNTLSGVFYSCSNLRLIDGILDVSNCVLSNVNYFGKCVKLESIKLYKLNDNIGLVYCKMLSSESVRYMIENATDKTITITLHPEAYERAIADTGVQTALANKTNVSLVKG